MNRGWLYKNDNPGLIIFCTGWGMDENPLKGLSSDRYDILHLSDFQKFDTRDELVKIVRTYETSFLVGWSMGVWAGQKLFEGCQELLQERIAINGTLCPVHELHGIPRKIFAGTMENWSKKNRKKFYLRMSGDKSTYSQFIQNEPERTVSNQKQELAYYLDAADCTDASQAIYSKIIISNNDRIVPTDNQLAYWGEENVLRIEGSHFPFYRWQKWDEMLLDVCTE